MKMLSIFVAKKPKTACRERDWQDRLRARKLHTFVLEPQTGLWRLALASRRISFPHPFSQTLAALCCFPRSRWCPKSVAPACKIHVVDGEGDAKRLAEAMGIAEISKIDYLLTTHYAGDQIGGVAAVDSITQYPQQCNQDLKSAMRRP